MTLLARLRAWLSWGRSAAPSAPAPTPAAPPDQEEARPEGAALTGLAVGLTPRDLERLRGVHPDLVRVVIRARATEPFTIIEGVRTAERQAQLYAEGRSRTRNSRHLTGHAVDLAPVPLDWSDRASFARLAAAMRSAARAEDVPIRWGGEFTGFYDGPHFELPRDRYPA